MAKSKYAPALFEVMNRQKNTGKLGVPKWWKGGSGSPQPEGAEPGDSGAVPEAETSGSGTPTTSLGPVVATLSPDAAPTETPAQAEGAAAAQPVNNYRPWSGLGRGINFRVESGRISVSLSPVHGAVICGGLLIALVAAYQVGKGFAGPVADKNSGLTLLDQKPNASVLDSPAGRTDVPPPRAGIGAAASPAARAVPEPPPAPPEEEVLKVGSHYLLFDTFPRDHLKSAEFVQKWLESEHKIHTVLRERKGRYWLIGIDVSGDKATCDRYADRIKALGPECSKALIKAGLPVYSLKDPMPFLIASEK